MLLQALMAAAERVRRAAVHGFRRLFPRSTEVHSSIRHSSGSMNPITVRAAASACIFCLRSGERGLAEIGTCPIRSRYFRISGSSQALSVKPDKLSAYCAAIAATGTADWLSWVVAGGN